jgi:hypothetical protein
MPDLNNDKNVYLLGAGFSKEVGLPLQDDFLLVAKEVFFKNPDIYRHFEKVFEYQDKLTKMKKYLNYPLLNLEHLFNLIEMDVFYSDNDEKRNIKNDFIKLICDVLIDRTPNPFSHDSTGNLEMNNSYQHYLPFIDLFIKQHRNDGRLILNGDTIISFNYDLILEGAGCYYNWEREQNMTWAYNNTNNFIKFNTIFGKTNIINDQLPIFFIKNRPNTFFSNENVFSEDDNSIKLIKLHGSINWKRAGDTRAFIVPPTWNKSEREIRALWDEAYNELIDAKRIIIIGYSFPETDIYVKSLLALALNENKVLQNIYFINPDKNIAKKACLSLLDTYFEKYCSYKEWEYSKFISSSEGMSFIKDKLNRSHNIISIGRRRLDFS